VVANGRAFDEKVLADPSAMPQGLEFEALLSLAATAYELKSGDDFDSDTSVSIESFSNAAGWAPTATTRPGRFSGPDVPPGNRRP
jgi:hypothetical protein